MLDSWGGGAGFYKVHLDIAVTLTKSPFLSALRFGKSSPSQMSEISSPIPQLPQIELMGKKPGPLCVNRFSLLGIRDRKMEAQRAPLGGLHWETLNRGHQKWWSHRNDWANKVGHRTRTQSPETHTEPTVLSSQRPPDQNWYRTRGCWCCSIPFAFLAGLLLFKQT